MLACLAVPRASEDLFIDGAKRCLIRKPSVILDSNNFSRTP